MTTAFPTALDAPTNPIATDAMNAVTVPHATQHANINDAVVALETKVGIDGSAVTKTHDYKLSAVTGTDKAVTSSDARLSDSRAPNGTAGGDLTGSYPNPTLAVARALASRQVIAGTGLTGGGDLTADRTLTVAYGTTAGTAAQGNDSRLSDSRAPNGSAGGDLTGTYPNPTIGNSAVSLAKMANLAASSILGNNTLSAAAPLALTAAQVKTLLAIASTDVSGLATVATSGSAADLTGTLAAARIAANSLALGKIAQGTARTLVGVVGASTADHADITINFQGVSAAVADIAITGTASPTTFGQLHRCTGTSAGYTVTLPVCSANAGQTIGFVMDRALTKLVTLVVQGSDVIAESLTTIVLWAGESIVLRVNAAGDGYDIVEWRKRAMRARNTTGAQSITASSQTLFNLVTADYDTGGLTDATNDVYAIRRAGKYAYYAYARLAAGSTAVRALLQVQQYPASHTGGTDIGTSEIPIPSTTLVGGHIVTGEFNFAAGDLCEASYFHNSAGARNIAWQFSIEELIG